MRYDEELAVPLQLDNSILVYLEHVIVFVEVVKRRGLKGNPLVELKKQMISAN